MTIKPIETEYAGYLFRSRLEARWAVFFDHMGFKWEYESEGFEVKGRGKRRRYLPDFLLPDLHAWVEVKGDPANLDLALLGDVLEGGDRGLFMLVLGQIPLIAAGAVPVHTFLTPTVDVRPSPVTHSMVFDAFNAIDALDEETKTTLRRVFADHPYPMMNVAMMKAFFVPSGFVPVGLPNAQPTAESALEDTTMWPLLPIPSVGDAYKAARMARFEHGETPERPATSQRGEAPKSAGEMVRDTGWFQEGQRRFGEKPDGMT